MYIYVYIYIPFSNGMLPACCKVLCSRRHVHGAPGPGSSCRPIHQVDQQTPGIPKKTLPFPPKCGCSDVHIPSSKKPKHIVSRLCGLLSLLTLCLFSKGSGIPGNAGALTLVKVLQGWMLQQVFVKPRHGHNVQNMLSPLVEQNPPRDFQVSLQLQPVSLPQRREVRSRPAVFEATNLQVTATGTIA